MENLNLVKNVIVVLSGKGGVGKSTLSVQIAYGLKALGKTVGLLDVDLCGPSIPKLLNLEDCTVHQCDQGWVPVYSSQDKQLSVMSIGFLLKHKDDPVIWRGPKKTAMIKQFVTDVCWGELDYLIVDTPPGTSDEHLSVIENLRKQITGAILITTPQNVAVADVLRELTFCRKGSVPVLGIVENMSGYICQNCSECIHVFSKGGGEELAKQENIPFLGQVPLDPNLAMCCENGESILDALVHSNTKVAVLNVIENLLQVAHN
ncbi:cytosolic Fe-S cluster assembly factor NUBP2 homolog [Clavelina lepadiformis]|uniref:cytosolic Fe-S cluster assembly factor NUBP2 homolog n=1 Tax=Clavelina lepadiformis TaxID=159417 RepID=UPI00404301CA